MLARSIIASFLFFSSSAFAQGISLPPLDVLESVANSKQWAHLLHYRKHPFSGRYISQNDSPNFFLAADGKTSLIAELQADLQQFMLTDTQIGRASCRERV